MHDTATSRALDANSLDQSQEFGKPLSGWRAHCYAVVFESDSCAGRWFDLCLMAAIFASVGIVVLDSIIDLLSFLPTYAAFFSPSCMCCSMYVCYVCCAHSVS